MEELVEVLYQWHKGQSIRGIKRSVGMDRKTIKEVHRFGCGIWIVERYGIAGISVLYEVSCFTTLDYLNLIFLH